MLNEPVKVNLGADNNKELHDYVYDQLEALINGHKMLFEQDLPEWRKIYEGTPKEKEKSWPWKNASNLVIQITATYADMLLARVMAAIHEVSPLWVMGLVGQWDIKDKGEEQRSVLEQFLNVVGLEPTQLAMYRNEYDLYHDAIKYGLSCLYVPYEEVWEDIVKGYDGQTLISARTNLYSGPKPKKLEYENFMFPARVKVIEEAEFKAVRKPLTKYDLESCIYNKIYDKEAVDKIINKPDRFGPDNNQKKKEEGQAKTQNAPVNAEWDIWECWFPYIHNGKKYRMIVSFHFSTKTVMRQIFNFYPDNVEPFFTARLGYEGGTLRGKGFCKILKDYQSEIATMHNQDIDSGTLANTNIYRVDPASRLDANISIFPSAVLPMRKDELEVFPMGRDNASNNIARQQLALELAKERVGVAPPIGGSGGGITNPKKGNFSAMGTFSVMQDGNRRTNINVTDFRLTHMMVGRFLLNIYANFGPGKVAETFGESTSILEKALENVKKGKLTIPVRAATASVNREIEKQNDMLLVGIMRQHYQWIGSILQALPQAPEHMQDYILKTIIAGDLIMKHVLRNFGHDDETRFIPESDFVKKLREGAGNGQQPNGQPTGATQTDSVQQTNPPTQGGVSQINAGQGSTTIPGIS